MGVVFRQAWTESQWTVLMGYHTISTNVRCYQAHHRDRWQFFCFQEDSALVHMHCACNTVQLLWWSRLPFSWAMAQQPRAERMVTRFRESYSSVSMNHKSKRLKKSSSDCMVEFWQCTNTAFEWKIRFLCFPVLPGSAEAQVTWGGTVKHLLIAYFISKISAKKNIKMRSRLSKLWQPKAGRFFETQCTTSLINFLHFIQSIASSFHICQIWQSFSITSLQVFFGLPPDFTPSTS